MTAQNTSFERELRLEKHLRKTPVLIPLITFFTASLLLSGIWFCMNLYQKEYYWSFIPAAFLIHSFFIVVVHDAAHQNITQTTFDRLILNLGAGLMLLPVYGEGFRRYHLIHHAHTNETIDPLWSPLKEKLFHKNRLVYLLFELIPLFSTIYGILYFNKNQEKTSKAQVLPGLKINYWFIVGSACISVGLILLFQPPLLFLLATLFVLNAISTFRHWSEHLGEHKDKESNTFWFPLGMGIGNHETHHHHAYVSWFTLMIGLFYRKKDTNPLRVINGVLLTKNYEHYKAD